MYTIAAATTTTTIFLVWLGSLHNPFRFIHLLAKELWSSKKFSVLFLSMLGILILNKYELNIEQTFSASMDYTKWAFHIEGQFAKSVQEMFNHPIVTEVLVFFYIIVFQSVLIASLAVYLLNYNKPLMYATCIAIMLNYGLAIPFYLFVPIHEVWTYPAAETDFLLLNAFPAFEKVYRPLSGINNCFPSLHTSISLTIMLLSYRSGNKRWMMITTISACIILFSVVYLGIHWLLDMLAGMVLAFLATTLGLRLSNSISSDQLRSSVPSQP